MLEAIAQAALAKVRKRVAEGECPVTPTEGVGMLENLVLHFADDRHKPPVPELKGHKPLVLYFKDDHDRDEFIAMIQEAKPGMVSRKL